LSSIVGSVSYVLVGALLPRQNPAGLFVDRGKPVNTLVLAGQDAMPLDAARHFQAKNAIRKMP
jgi:hypothetical protein